ESVLSVFACRRPPRNAAVSAGSPTCAISPAAASSSATYRHPVQPSNANSTSVRPRETLGQPPRQMRPVGRRDPSPLDPAGDRVHVVERDLLPVDVQPAYDGHRTSSSSKGRVNVPYANGYQQ